MIFRFSEKVVNGSSRVGTYTNLRRLQIPATLALVFLLPEDYSPIPFTIDFLRGPSMLPTIHPEGEVYLRIKAWAIDSLKVGQVVVVQDFKGRYACKRIIGIGNDEVQSKGEFFVSLYRGRQDGGIPVIPSQNLFPSWWQKLITNSDGKLKIPLGHIWLEGDNPLESVDSRHYGPLPISSVKGIILYRLWPWNRTGDDTSSCVISLIRPKPLEGEKNHQ